MTFKFVSAIALFAATICAMAACYVFFAMIGEVNQRRPEDHQIRNFIVLPVTYLNVWLEYRRMFPKGALPRILVALSAIFVSLMSVALVSSCQIHLLK